MAPRTRGHQPRSWLALLTITLLLAGCASPVPTASPALAATPPPTATPTASPTPMAPATPMVATPSPTPRPTPTPTLEMAGIANATWMLGPTSSVTVRMTNALFPADEIVRCAQGAPDDRSVWYAMAIPVRAGIRVEQGGNPGAVVTGVYGPFAKLPSTFADARKPLWCVYGVGPTSALSETVGPGTYLFQLATMSAQELVPTLTVSYTPVSPEPPLVVVVVPGDTLSDIAAEHGVPLAVILDANPQIADPNVIVPGEQVAIPAAAVNKLAQGFHTTTLPVAPAGPASRPAGRAIRTTGRAMSRSVSSSTGGCGRKPWLASTGRTWRMLSTIRGRRGSRSTSGRSSRRTSGT